MSLSQQINSDFLAAYKIKNEQLISVLRMIKSALANKAIELKKKDEGVSDEEAMAVIKTEIKKRLDSVEMYNTGGRPELAAKEADEVEILKKYLPAQLSEEEIKSTVDRIIAALPEEDRKDFSKAIRAVMAELKGKADGGVISKLVKETLGQ